MPNQTPSFVKVLVGRFSKKLRIPDSFVDEFGQDLDGKLVLTSNAGDPVIVSVGRGSRGCFFETGWMSFVEDHELQEGDYLVFNFTGRKTVDVVVYDPTGCVKRDAQAQPSKHCTSPGRNRETERSRKKPRKGSLMRKAGRREVQFRKRMTKGTKSNPSEAPIKIKSEEEEYPSDSALRDLADRFHVVYKKYMEYVMCIPLRFSETTSLAVKETAQLQDLSGKIWPVTIISGGQGASKRFGRGWSTFALANRLVPGDIIAFSYKPELDLIQVKIHKPSKNNAVNDSEAGKRPWQRTEAAVVPERSKLYPSYGRNGKTERFSNRAPPPAPGLADSFRVVYNKHNERSNYVCIPVRFSEAAKLSPKKTALLQDSSGKVWPVRLIAVGMGRLVRFCGGWKVLAAANGVAVGDEIEFSYRPEKGLIEVKVVTKKSVYAINVWGNHYH